MDDFTALHHLLSQELTQQNKLLEVLSRERAAIVKMDQEQITALNSEKEKIIHKARELEATRSKLLSRLRGSAEEGNAPTLRELLVQCSSEKTKKELNTLAQEIRKTATVVQELNSQNAGLIKHSIGLISSTIAIFLSARGDALPTYGHEGQIKKTVGQPGSGRTLSEA